MIQKRCVLLSLIAVGTLPALNLSAQMTIFETALSPRIANYRVEVSLDTENRLLHGRQMILWHNQTEDLVPDLMFHLYLNGFRNTESTAMKESGGAVSAAMAEEDGWGFSDPKSIRVQAVQDGVGELNFTDKANHPDPATMSDITASITYRAPDDGNEHDRTVMHLPLTEPLQPGGSIWIAIDFTAQLPDPPYRTGAREEFFMVAQWFPKIGVFEKGAWNCHQFHANTEFYADFGVYDVFMTVPRANVLGATGLEVSVTDNGDGTATHYYHAEDVHDFAWTTSPRYQVHTTRSQDVEIRLLLQPDHAHQAERHLESARRAVVFFQDRYGDYPFPNLTVVDPRPGAIGAGGMEYPTLITVGTHAGMPEGLRLIEVTVGHEFAHMFWYSLLASNEFEESWLDEGFSSYAEMMFMRDWYGPPGDTINFPFFRMNDWEHRRRRYSSGATRFDPMLRDGWRYYSSSSYALNSYSKPATMLFTLHHFVGEDIMERILRTYVEQFRFKHPTSRDFVSVASEVSGQDLDWFFDQALFTNRTIDYLVSSVESNKIGTPQGYDFGLDTTDPVGAAEDEDANYHTVVKVRRDGDFIFPVEIEFVFENDVRLRETWAGRDTWKKFEFTRKERLVSATVDPDMKVPMDINVLNNGLRVKANTKPANRLTIGFWGLVQNLVEALAF